MGGTFNPQILAEKLVKLNSSQQSIETLSHWCIFHMNKARQVVETWARQFHSSPCDQRLPFLYLANDILQNSRRKGSEFVGEFWKVLPGALCDVIDNGDEFGRNAALRLVSIWEERKVFGSRGQILKEDVVGRSLETSNRNVKHSASKLKNTVGNALDKIVSGYKTIDGGQLDEDAVMSKCRNTISCLQKVDKEIGERNGSGMMEELKMQHATLRDCIEQLTAVESSRANLVTYLRETLEEQEMKLDQVRNEVEAAHTQSEKAESLGRQWLNEKNGGKIMYTIQLSFGEEVSASTSSAEEGSHHPEKRARRIENEQPPLPPSHEQPPPPPPSSPPPLLPMPPVQPYPFMQTPPYGYRISQQPLPVNDVSSYTPNVYLNYQIYTQPSTMPITPMSRPIE